MILEDFNIKRSEEYLATLLDTTTDGAKILDIPQSLKRDGYIDADFKMIIRGGKRDNTVFSTLEKALKSMDKQAIVSVRDEDFGAHTIIVDRIEDNRVFIRDPLPLNQGSTYSIHVDGFKNIFNKKFITFKL